MNKLITITLIIILIVGIFFTSGCLDDEPQTTVSTTQITNDSQASQAVSDLGSDVSGLGKTLDDIDGKLG